MIGSYHAQRIYFLLTNFQQQVDYSLADVDMYRLNIGFPRVV